MDPETGASDRNGAENAPSPFDSSLRELESQFDLALGTPERVRAACSLISDVLRRDPIPERISLCLNRLLPLLRKRQGPMALALQPLIEEFLPRVSDPAGLACELFS